MDKLQRFLAKQEQVKLTYLFGSCAKGNQGPLSDVDVAIFLDKRLSKKERQKLKLELINVVSSILKTNKLDLVVINDSPVDLNYEIIKHGKILQIRDVGEKTDIESGILSHYLDRKYDEQRSLSIFLDRIIERRGS